MVSMEQGHVYVIAEAGVNHNGDMKLARKLVEEAAKAGADCVKFQTFRPENVVSVNAEKAAYQKETTDSSESQLDMLRKLTLKDEDYMELASYANSLGLDFCSTPFDLDSIRFLDGLNMPFWKIPSGEITNLPYLRAIGKTRKQVVLSTGMSALQEVGDAVDVLKRNGTKELTLLHCNTQYPTPFEDVNLQAMLTMRDAFHLPVGYSDHTPGIEIPVAAVAMGAVMIEKHFTLDRNMEGPDHKASLEPDELRAMVTSIRHVEEAMGDGIKCASRSEEGNIAIVRKSIVAARPIRKGELLTEENLTTKRPGDGISPMHWDEFIGTKAVRDFAKDEELESFADAKLS